MSFYAVGLYPLRPGFAGSVRHNPHSGPSGHLSPCPGERKDGRKVSANLQRSLPLPRAGGEVARRAGVVVMPQRLAAGEARRITSHSNQHAEAAA
jgi:hypothetical protein